MNVKRVLDSLNLNQIRTQLATHYHADGPGRTPINPLAMLKAQLAKHLLNIISDRRLALRLKHDHKVARARAIASARTVNARFEPNTSLNRMTGDTAAITRNIEPRNSQGSKRVIFSEEFSDIGFLL